MNSDQSVRFNHVVEMMHGDGYVAVLKQVRCRHSHECQAERERVLTLTPAKARELAADLERGARYVEERAARDEKEAR